MKLPSALNKVLAKSADLFEDIIEGKSGHGKTVSVHLKKTYKVRRLLMRMANL